VTPTLCQPCGRHKDRCRCGGWFKVADWLADKADWWNDEAKREAPGLLRISRLARSAECRNGAAGIRRALASGAAD
jgi:hypothetical protein